MKIDLKFAKPLFEGIVLAVQQAEVMFSEKGAGPARKEWVLDVICKTWSWPFPLNLFQRTIFGLLIDLVVYMFNRIKKNWAEDIPPHMVEVYKRLGA